MASDQWLHTSRTLLIRIRDCTDQDAWRQFVVRYGPHILRWVRKRAVTDDDAEEVTQRVLVKLVQQMRDVRYDPQRGSFRGWLRTVTLNTWRDFVRQNQRHRERLEVLDPEELAIELAEEREREMVEMALLHVQRRISPQAWDVFRLRALDGWSARQVGDRLGMSVAAVNMHKSRVQASVREEILRLREEDRL